MHLGLLIYGSLDTLTGGYLYDRLMVDRWRALGDQVTVVSLPRRRGWRPLADNLDAGLLRRLAALPLDALIQDELCHPSLVWLNRRLRRRVTYPVLALVHLVRASEWRSSWRNVFVRWLESRYLAGVDGVICNSQDTRRRVEALVGRAAPGIVVIPGRDHLSPPVSPVAIRERVAQSGPLRVVHVGNLVPRKGLHTLLAALALLPASDVYLTVVGSLEHDPAYVARVQRQIAATGLGERVELLGSLPNEALGPILARGDLFVMVSQIEAFGIVYVEALGAGLPVVASTSGAAGEIIRPGREGHLVPAEDPAALAAALRPYVVDRARLLPLSLAARARYETFPTWAEGARAIHAFAAGLAG